MPQQIPSNFDVFNEKLDGNEIYIRDTLKVKIENWAKFRFLIHAGNYSNVLQSNFSIPIEVKQSFIELAKSHYETVNSIGYVKQCFDDLGANQQFKTTFHLIKGLKEFYIHIGSVLDNLSRLIFIINHPNSPTLKNRNRLIRHWIDWPYLVSNFPFQNYLQFANDSNIKEILNIRNNFIHNWTCIILTDNNGEAYWPDIIRTERNFLWHYEEVNDFKQKYKSTTSISNMVLSDYNYIEKFQNDIFAQLILDLRVFEINHNLKIL